jgi:hypothetical protein
MSGLLSASCKRTRLKSGGFEEIVKLIEEDLDFGILALGASTDPKGPGPLLFSLAAGTKAGTFPIPVTIVPGNLTIEDIQGLA